MIDKNYGITWRATTAKNCQANAILEKSQTLGNILRTFVIVWYDLACNQSSISDYAVGNPFSTVLAGARLHVKHEIWSQLAND